MSSKHNSPLRARSILYDIACLTKLTTVEGRVKMGWWGVLLIKLIAVERVLLGCVGGWVIRGI